MDVMRRRTSIAYPLLTALFLLCTLLKESGGTMHCLVSRPGYGLVSEECPTNTVACRIRIDQNAVQFYQYSPLYDRNQFVCVLKNEYGSEHKSGCQQNRSGRIRCWCFGHSDCNTPETSKQLYTAFLDGNEQHLGQVVEKIDFADISFSEDMRTSSSSSSTPIHSPTLDNPIPQTTRWPASKEVMKGVGALSEEKRRQGQKTASASLSNPASGGAELETTQLKSMRYNGGRGGAGGRVNSANNDKNPSMTGFSLSKSTNEKNSSSFKNSSGTMLINQGQAHGHLHRMHVKNIEKQPTSSARPTTSTTETAEHSSKTKEKPTPVKSEFDTKNRVHIIHVNARDEYEHVIGSQQFAEILDKQNKEFPSTDPAIAYGQQLEEEELEEKEAGRDPMQEAASLDIFANTPSQQVVDLRRRQRNGFDGTSAAKSKALDLDEGGLEEYFDSAFYASLAPTTSFSLFTALFVALVCIALN